MFKRVGDINIISCIRYCIFFGIYKMVFQSSRRNFRNNLEEFYLFIDKGNQVLFLILENQLTEEVGFKFIFDIFFVIAFFDEILFLGILKKS